VSDAIDPRKLLVEVIGAFGLVFAGAGSVMLGVGNARWDNPLATALVHGLVIAVLISAFGRVSTGQFNPAVTAGMWVTRRIGSLAAAGNVIAQLVGAIGAALMLVLLFPEGLRDAANLGTPVVGPGVELMQAIGIEAVLTFVLVLVYFGTLIDRPAARIDGLAVGLTVTVGMLVGGYLTGGIMNPARALGPALLSGDWTDQLVWWIGPVIGGVLAAMVYHYVFAEDASSGAQAT
jgi:aquaporin Z